MKFQLNVEIDEREAGLTQREVIDYVLETLSVALADLDAYFDVGCATNSIVSGLTN